ncbi:hypothetical protein TIFTF001_007990 [Ficus carica]|uniref:Uncharacterized protein n=1 Tax=Ficus carica TaxID=3494 RepID=A0AA88D062_FICCA|nr:hypothetical protein TIFTF001_007990 [Ficus carica]
MWEVGGSHLHRKPSTERVRPIAIRDVRSTTEALRESRRRLRGACDVGNGREGHDSGSGDSHSCWVAAATLDNGRRRRGPLLQL